MSLACAVLLHCHGMEGEKSLLQNLDIKGCSLFSLSSEITVLAFLSLQFYSSYLYYTVLFVLGFESRMKVIGVGGGGNITQQEKKCLVKTPDYYWFSRGEHAFLSIRFSISAVGLRSVSSSVEEMLPLPCHPGSCGVMAPALSQKIILLSPTLQSR